MYKIKTRSAVGGGDKKQIRNAYAVPVIMNLGYKVSHINISESMKKEKKNLPFLILH